MLNSLLNFLTPGNGFQWFFLILIITPLLLTITNAFRLGNEKNWALKFQQGKKNELTIEYGSVSELSEAVATTWEKALEALPGILLILGLLGTFIGLGLALDEAGKTVGASSGSGMDDNTMSHLSDLINGLGTKFKTSTWGIIAFLILKIASGTLGLDEKRLAWCVQQVKNQEDNRKKIDVEFQQQNFEKLNSSINDSVGNLDSNVGQQLKLNQESIHSSSKHIVDHLETGNSTRSETNQLLNEIIQQLQTTIEKNSANFNQLLEVSTNQHLHLISKIDLLAVNSNTTNSLLADFVKSNKDNIERMSLASEKMVEASELVGSSATDLKSTVTNFEKGVTSVLDGVKSELSAVISKMNQDFDKNLEKMSTKLDESTRNIGSSVEILNQGVKTTLADLNSNLNSTINGMNNDFKMNLTEMSNSLKDSTNNISNAVANLSSGVDQTLQTLQNSVNMTMDRINSNFVKNIEKMSSRLETTTKEISNSINTSSEFLNKSILAIDNSINIINSSIKSSEENQKRTSLIFEGSVDKLEEFVETQENLIKDLGGSIKLGLTSVSDAALQTRGIMNSLNTTNESIVGFTQKIDELITTLIQPETPATEMQMIEES